MDLSIFDIATFLFVLAAFFGFLNVKLIRLPFTVALTLGGLAASAGLLVLDSLIPGLGLAAALRGFVGSIDFPASLMRGMLGFLLFAGALHLNFEDLLERKLQVGTLATLGVAISTVVTGTLCYFCFQLFEGTRHIPFLWCLVFGALIAPTDPIAVLSVMRSVGAPRGLAINVAGESLLNDGMGIVAFSLLVVLAGAGAEGTGTWDVGVLALREVGGGIALGLLAGYLVYRAMRAVDQPNLEVLFSIALVMTLMTVAFRIHVSGPLACVTAGLFIGNLGRKFAMRPDTVEALDTVWSFIDDGLNAVLFLLVGLEVVTVGFSPRFAVPALLAVPAALAGRFIGVGVPVTLLRFLRVAFSRNAVILLTWSGLRGGISVALALSLPSFPGREIVVTATYAVVIFSIVFQGLTVKPMVRRLTARA